MIGDDRDDRSSVIILMDKKPDSKLPSTLAKAQDTHREIVVAHLPTSWFLSDASWGSRFNRLEKFFYGFTTIMRCSLSLAGAKSYSTVYNRAEINVRTTTEALLTSPPQSLISPAKGQTFVVLTSFIIPRFAPPPADIKA